MKHHSKDKVFENLKNTIGFIEQKDKISTKALDHRFYKILGEIFKSQANNTSAYDIFHPKIVNSKTKEIFEKFFQVKNFKYTQEYVFLDKLSLLEKIKDTFFSSKYERAVREIHREKK